MFKHQTTIRKKTLLAIALCLLSLPSCYRVQDKIEPEFSYVVQDKYIRSLQTSFPPLDEYEKKQEWGKEYLIGVAFAKKLDLYRAVTAFKRSEILIPDDEYHRKQEVEYYIILSYYLGRRYDEALDTFEDSSLTIIDTKFPTYHDLLVILYECYSHTENPDKAKKILSLLQKQYPETAKQLDLSTSITSAELSTMKKKTYSPETKNDVNTLYSEYLASKKSVAAAQGLNALLPGAGYLYVGQKQSALTAFLLNGLFIAAAVHFFTHGHTAAGIITTSFEAGWYFGGIYGAGEATKLYNERLYEAKAFNAMNNNKLFPVFTLQYGF